MRALITVGYDKLLFPEDFDAKAAVELLAKGKFVKERGHGKDRAFEIDTDYKIAVEFVSCDLPGLPDANEILNGKILTLQTELEKKQVEVWDLQRKLKKLEPEKIQPAAPPEGGTPQNLGAAGAVDDEINF